MKTLALTTLLLTVAAVDDWKICKAGSDCTTAGSKCCNASLTGKPTVKVCGPSSTKIISNGVADYGGYSFSCLEASNAPGAEKTAAERLIGGTAFVVGALYFLA